MQDGRATLRIGFLADRLVDKTVSGSQDGMLTGVGGYCLRMAPNGEVQEHQQDEDAGIAYPLSPGLFLLVAFIEFHLTIAVKVNSGGNLLLAIRS